MNKGNAHCWRWSALRSRLLHRLGAIDRFADGNGMDRGNKKENQNSQRREARRVAGEWNRKDAGLFGWSYKGGTYYVGSGCKWYLNKSEFYAARWLVAVSKWWVLTVWKEMRMLKYVMIDISKVVLGVTIKAILRPYAYGFMLSPKSTQEKNSTAPTLQ